MNATPMLYNSSHMCWGGFVHTCANDVLQSQFLSAMLMAAPLGGKGVRVEIVDELISKPYVELTRGLMRKFGVDVQVENWESPTPSYLIEPSVYQSPGSILVEGDASSASYFLAGAAITGGTVKVIGCGSASVQVSGVRD